MFFYRVFLFTLCVGYCGADVKAVCAEAALCALRRRYPQIYTTTQKLLLDVSSINVEGRDFLSAMRKIVPASQRAVASPAKALTPAIQPLLANTLNDALKALQKVFPHMEQTVKKKKGNGTSKMSRVRLIKSRVSSRH